MEEDLSNELEEIRIIKKIAPRATKTRIILPSPEGKYKLRSNNHFVLRPPGLLGWLRPGLEAYHGRIEKSDINRIIEKASQAAAAFPRAEAEFNNPAYWIGFIMIFFGVILFVNYKLFGFLVLFVLGVFLMISSERKSAKQMEMERDPEFGQRKQEAVQRALDKMNFGEFYNSDFTVQAKENGLYLQIDFCPEVGGKPNRRRYEEINASDYSSSED